MTQTTQPLDQNQIRVFEDFLHQNGLDITYRIMSVGRSGLLARSYLLEEAIDSFRHAVVSPVNPTDPDFNEWVKVVHAKQLDVLAKIFMIYEDFLTYSHVLRTDPSNLSHTLASKQSNYYKEIEYLEKLKKKEIWRYFRFPDVNQLGLDRGDARFVRQIMRVAARHLHKKIQRVAKFWKDYYNVYLKYKHRFSIVIGLSQIEGPNISSHIYVRNLEKSKVYTYIIPCNVATLNYYEEVVDDLAAVFALLWDSFMLWLYNRGGPFFPPIPKEAVPEEENPRLQALINKMPFLQVREILYLTINLTEKRARIARRALSKKFIYKAPTDIFEKGRMTIR